MEAELKDYSTVNRFLIRPHFSKTKLNTLTKLSSYNFQFITFKTLFDPNTFLESFPLKKRKRIYHFRF
jgi:hypothetical protein